MHDNCRRHGLYGMTCESFERLLARAKGLCEVCTREPHSAIDHDHALGMDCPRGLVCQPCNQHLSRVDFGERAPTLSEYRYISRAWHLGNPARPQITSRVRKVLKAFRFPPAIWAAVEAACEEQGINPSDFVRAAVEAALADTDRT